MQERPDKAALLDAVVRFLTVELLPVVPDKGLNFRVLIAANLLSIVSAELRGEDDRNAREVERLRALVPTVAADPIADGGEALRAQVRTLKAALSQQLRDETISSGDAAVVQAIRASLRDTLAYANPRFDLRDDVD